MSACGGPVQHSVFERVPDWPVRVKKRVSKGRTMPTRGISVMIQPKILVLSIIGRYQRHASRDAGSIFTACRIRNRHTAQFEIQRE